MERRLLSFPTPEFGDTSRMKLVGETWVRDVTVKGTKVSELRGFPNTHSSPPRSGRAPRLVNSQRARQRRMKRFAAFFRGPGSGWSGLCDRSVLAWRLS